MAKHHKQILEFGSQGVTAIKTWINHVSIPAWSVPFVLGVLVVVSYGIQIQKSGFYWDGWVLIHSLNKLGPDRFGEILGENRQMTATLYALTTRIFKDIPIRWQVFGLVSRWASGVALWWTLRQLWQAIWPHRVYQANWIALLFVVYPSFTQQSISVVYSHIFFNFSIFLISLGAMVKALRKPHWFWWLASWLTAGYILFALEYYLGLELLRPLLIWILLTPKALSLRDKVRQAMISWSPYLVLLSAYAVWRFYLLPPSRYGVGMKDIFLAEPLETLRSLVQTIAMNLFQVSLLVWEKVVRLTYLFTEPGERAWIYRLVVFGVSGFALFLFGKWMYTVEQGPIQRSPGQGNWIRQPVFLGAVFMTFAGLPYWSVPLEITLDFASNRHTIPMMIGASIVVVDLVERLASSTRRARIILALLVGFAAGYQFDVSTDFSTEWSFQRDFLWQLLWRVPSLEPGTMILGDAFPFPFSDDEAVTSMINLAYRSAENTYELPYGFFFVRNELGHELDRLGPETRIQKKYGPLDFSGSFLKMIAISYSGNSCLRVLSRPDGDLGQVYPGLLSEVVHFSDASLIVDEDGTYNLANLERFFGKEPAHTWCYYYQKAELARQSKQWNRVAKLGDQAGKRGYEPYVPEELFPFIEGYANVGEWEKAQQLTLDAFKQTRTLRPDLCAIWKRIPSAATAAGAGSSIHRDVLEELECDWLE